ncbi:MAG: betaine--homocysteine S-methyltransferase [Anaerolineales bacterium]
MSKLHTLLKSSDLVLADGATGTMLFQAGLQFGDPPETWNILHPEIVRGIHRQYLQSGSQIVLTNTFGGNRFRLAMHHLQDRVKELNTTAAILARTEVDAAGGQAVVAGDIGPSGEILEPLGTLAYEEAVEGFAGQADALVFGGVDAIWIETMSALEEIQAAIEGVRRVSADTPIIATMTFDTNGHTMMGVSPEQALEFLAGQDVAAAGGNCGNGPDEILRVIEKMAATGIDIPLVAKSNAGIPRLENQRPVYSAEPAEMADYSVALRAAGARIIGACCGSTPEHVHCMATTLADTPVDAVPTHIRAAAGPVAPAEAPPRRRSRRRARNNSGDPQP